MLQLLLLLLRGLICASLWLALAGSSSSSRSRRALELGLQPPQAIPELQVRDGIQLQLRLWLLLVVVVVLLMGKMLIRQPMMMIVRRRISCRILMM